MVVKTAIGTDNKRKCQMAEKTSLNCALTERDQKDPRRAKNLNLLAFGILLVGMKSDTVFFSLAPVRPFFWPKTATVAQSSLLCSPCAFIRQY